MVAKSSFDATAPIRLGTTGWAGKVVHRVGERTESNYRPWLSPCGIVLSRPFEAAPADVHWSLCSKCFTSSERHAVFLEEMGRS